MVEMTRVELVSENIFTPASTGVGYAFGFPSYKRHNQGLYYGSFRFMTDSETKAGSRSPLIFALILAVVL